MNMNSVNNDVPPYILLLLLLGFMAMFAASFSNFMRAPADSTVRMNAASPESAPEPGLTEQQAEELAALMVKIQTNPNDVDALMEIGNIFLAAEDWGRVEVFLSRAVVSRPTDMRLRYILAVALYQQEKMREAAAAFAQVLTLEKNPAAQYNLAVIYKYHMDKADEARLLFEQIVASPDADMDTVNRAKKELQP